MGYGPVKKREVVKRLRFAGFEKADGRGKGSHEWYVHKDGRALPIRNQEEFYGGPLKDIERQSGVKML